MSDHFRPVADPPTGLVVPRRPDPSGRTGPTPGQARGPGFRRTTPGFHVPAGTPTSVEQRILEQAQRLPPGGAVGGWASLRLHGAAYFDGVGRRGDRPVPLVLPPGRTLHPFPGGRAVRASATPAVVVQYGVPCTDPYAALLWELGQPTDATAALVAVDMALAAGVVRHDRLRSLTWDDLPRTRRSEALGAIQAADPRSLSPRETWLRWVWTDVADLGRPRCNWMVLGPDGRHLATPDLLDPVRGVAADYDGAAHRGAARHRRDERRKEALLTVGLEHVTVVGQGPGDESEVAGRLLAAADRAARRHEPRLWTVREGRLPGW
ncbi:hypothetical protein ASG49_03275 [Marmoricola sp. Leaf446]|uniref:hypothetical protein n=1 Tax=Marmoricola sp. Leaf446 TaxID=1736379 RepID=UPI0006F5DDA2|nr:hypothetical protein [Marmoricola sp. Leaf446]KQT93977.1 hypothetical protein ASG49_03275 [Marmoricola sp. Leaf446]